MHQGASDRDFFEHLLISIHTVKEYGKSIRRNDQVKSRLQLIRALLGRKQAPVAACPRRSDPPGPADLGRAARPMPRQTREVETGVAPLLWGQELAPLAL
jgi:hypothetical protein